MTIGVGVIGCGVRGQHSYEQVLARHPECEVKAVSQYPRVSAAMLEGKDPAGHARQYAEGLAAEYLDTHEQVLARDDVHLISLMCEPRAAPDLVEACCAAGKHIVRDKPICLDLPGADRIVNAVEGSPAEMLVTLGTRFSPTLQTAREQILGGEIGDLLTVTFTYLQAGGPLEGFTASQGYLDAVGGGEVTNFGHYAIDYVLWLVGSKVETVYATMGSHFYEDYQAIGMEDLGQLAMRFGNGVIATVITGRTTTQHKPDSYFRMDATGSAGTVVCTGPEEQIIFTNGAPQTISVSVSAIDAMIAAFVEAIESGQPSPITARDGREVLRVLKAAYRSAEENRPVALSEL